MNQKEQRTVFLHKNALTKGIQEFTVFIEDLDNGLVSFIKNGCTSYFHKQDYSTTLKEAKEKAEIKRIAKIRNIKEQLERLEDMTFV